VIDAAAVSDRFAIRAYAPPPAPGLPFVMPPAFEPPPAPMHSIVFDALFQSGGTCHDVPVVSVVVICTPGGASGASGSLPSEGPPSVPPSPLGGASSPLEPVTGSIEMRPHAEDANSSAVMVARTDTRRL
jgi:hypothetical protein